MVLGEGDLLVGRLVFFDALRMEFRKFKLRMRSANCAVCGDAPTITDTKSFDYDEFCGLGCSVPVEIPAAHEISPQDFQQLRSERENEKKPVALIDVRPAHQFDIVHLQEAVNIP